MSIISSLLSSQGDLGRELAERMERVERMLNSVVNVDDLVVDPVTSHLAKAGGKRLRPALCLMAAELGPNSASREVFEACLVVELTHLASLYHDDVMDEAPLRRGVESAQLVFGNSSAILAGDVLFARASSIIADLGPQAVKLHAQTFERLCSGQLHEVVGVRGSEDPIEHYIHVLADKTGSLIAASARYGVIFSGGSDEVAEAVARYGELLGVAFQLADDVIDLVSDPEATGKTPGTDLLEGVDTMPTLLLRTQAAAGTIDDAGKEILALLDSGHLAEGDNLARAVALLKDHEVVAHTKELAERLAVDAVNELDPLPAGEVKDAFNAFAFAMVHRMS
ncbi:MAG: polyprenyl synthetase family protein [Actinomycetaceae bacterium]|nr:polyprenyl synthetase family protein [Arcanobacterium sp.]MDD7505010.1 polyprenyl synthetase family protein [Actinomycetaceae bacterium]MDY6143333.1 polyprenyl synthetase family protein [Arcanobacterium sp.]